jgi:hypothetical protein
MFWSSIQARCCYCCCSCSCCVNGFALMRVRTYRHEENWERFTGSEEMLPNCMWYIICDLTPRYSDSLLLVTTYDETGVYLRCHSLSSCCLLSLHTSALNHTSASPKETILKLCSLRGGKGFYRIDIPKSSCEGYRPFWRTDERIGNYLAGICGPAQAVWKTSLAMQELQSLCDISSEKNNRFRLQRGSRHIGTQNKLFSRCVR